MGIISKVAIVIIVAAIFASFFLPWVSVGSPVAGGINKLLAGKNDSSFYSISGFQVPIMANGRESKLMISIIQLFNPGVKDADQKSWLIWVVPGLAVAILILLWLWGKNKWLHVVLGIIAVAIFGVATFKILTTDLNKLILKVSIAFGLWSLLVGYLLLGGVCLLNFVTFINRKNK